MERVVLTHNGSLVTPCKVCEGIAHIDRLDFVVAEKIEPGIVDAAVCRSCFMTAELIHKIIGINKSLGSILGTLHNTNGSHIMPCKMCGMVISIDDGTFMVLNRYFKDAYNWPEGKFKEYILCEQCIDKIGLYEDILNINIDLGDITV